MYQLTGDNLVFLLIIFLWVLPWKGYSMWIASKNNHKVWFVVLLIVNTFGLLEIIYVFGVANKKISDVKKTLFRIVTPKKKPKQNTP